MSQWNQHLRDAKSSRKTNKGRMGQKTTFERKNELDGSGISWNPQPPFKNHHGWQVDTNNLLRRWPQWTRVGVRGSAVCACGCAPILSSTPHWNSLIFTLPTLLQNKHTRLLWTGARKIMFWCEFPRWTSGDMMIFCMRLPRNILVFAQAQPVQSRSLVVFILKCLATVAS